MTTTETIIAFAFAFLLGGTLAYIFWRQRRDAKKGEQESGRSNNESLPARQLQLQAYERLILLTDRIALPNLISRISHQGTSARDMQLLLTQTIRQEFDYNVTQQIYVSTEAWDAVKNLKDQNLFIINQVASFLPPEATGIDLSKHLLEMLVQNPKASLHTIVSEVLSYEAKKIIR